MGATWFSSNLSSLSQQEGGEQSMVVAMSVSNRRKAYIYRPKGRLSSLKPPHHVRNHKRSQPKSDAYVRLGN
jgi:hypothetical protein